MTGDSPTPARSFAERVVELPRLGLGISTEFGAGRTGLDVLSLARSRPQLVSFLEIGADLERGIDDDARAWIADGRPTTYHFLDVNLEEPEDLDVTWIVATAELARSVNAAWLCGDAGLWHIGPRDRGHGTLLPPILVRESAEAMAEAVRELRRQTGFEVLPENPPAQVLLGDLHLLEYFAQVAAEADSGLLLDVAHLAICQHAQGRQPLDGFADFDLTRVVEVHVAGATPFEQGGRTFYDDDHSPQPLEATWEIFDHVIAHAPNLRAVVYECERNRASEVLPVFERLRAALEGTQVLAEAP